MTEHEKQCVDHCPNCGAEHGGYDELNFYGGESGTSGVFVRFRCGECGMEHVERYTYDATWYETEGARDYFPDVVSAVDYWKREVLGESEEGGER